MPVGLSSLDCSTHLCHAPTRAQSKAVETIVAVDSERQESFSRLRSSHVMVRQWLGSAFEQ